MSWHVKLGSALTVFGIALLTYVFFKYYPSNRDLLPNEIGDAFAGFVSGIALIWLVISVYQQGEELKRTREEVHLQRLSLDNMVNEGKNQVNALNSSFRMVILSGFMNVLSERLAFFNALSYQMYRQLNVYSGGEIVEIDSEGAVDRLSVALTSHFENCVESSSESIHYGDLNPDFFDDAIEGLKYNMIMYVAKFDDLLLDAKKFDIEEVAYNYLLQTRFGALYEEINNLLRTKKLLRFDLDVE